MYKCCIRSILNVLLWLLYIYCFCTACTAHAHQIFHPFYCWMKTKIKWTTASKFLKQNNQHKLISFLWKLAAYCVSVSVPVCMCTCSWKKAGLTFHFSQNIIFEDSFHFCVYSNSVCTVYVLPAKINEQKRRTMDGCK